MKVQFIDVGRNKVSGTYTVKDTKALHKEIGKHILSKGWSLEETDDPDTWQVWSGVRPVGTVKVLEA